MATHQPTKDYVARRTAEGMPRLEIIRCLKRYVARQLYPLAAVADDTSPRQHPSRALLTQEAPHVCRGRSDHAHAMGSAAVASVSVRSGPATQAARVAQMR